MDQIYRATPLRMSRLSIVLITLLPGVGGAQEGEMSCPCHHWWIWNFGGREAFPE
jgi:hypothetical protein